MTVRSCGCWIVVACAALLLAGCQVSEMQVDNWVAANGFIALKAPNQLDAPGALVYRRNYDPKNTRPEKVTLGFLCNPKYSVALYKHRPLESSTLDRVTVTKFNGGMSVGIPAISKIVSLNAKLKAANSIVADISDVKIYAFALDDLAAIRDRLGPECRRLVNGNVLTRNAFQVTQALQATVDVRVQMNASADARARARFVRQLANLGFTMSGDQATTVKGKALIFGVQLEPITRRIPSTKGTPVAARGFEHLHTRTLSARAHTR